MNNNNKGLIPQYRLYDIIYKCIKHELDRHIEIGRTWTSESKPDFLKLCLYGDSLRMIDSSLHDDHWEIFTGWHGSDDIKPNIKVFKDHLEFLEESHFGDFDKELMRRIYEKIKEYVEDDNIKEETLFDIQNKIIPHDRLYDIIYNYTEPELDLCIKMNCNWRTEVKPHYFRLDLSKGAIEASFEGDHWVISSSGYMDDVYVLHKNIKIFGNNNVEFNNNSKFEDFSREFMYGLYMKIKEYFEDDSIKEENKMNDMLITKVEVQEIVNDSCKDIISVCEQNGFWSTSLSKDCIGWSMKYGDERMTHHICVRLIGDAWYIWNEFANNGIKPNIEIYSDHVIFNKDSEFTDFSRVFMYNLYKAFEEYISKKSIRCDSNEKIKDCDCKNHYKPFYKTMTKGELKLLIEAYITPRLNVFKDLNYKYHLCSAPAVDLYWSIYGHERYYELGIIKRNDHWAIYTNRYSKENLNVNIKIFDNDHVEFVDDSKFEDFDRDFMYGLYLKIKEVVEGNKEENK